MLLSMPHTRGHDAGTCCSDMLLSQNHVLFTHRRHVAGTCSGSEKDTLHTYTRKCSLYMSLEQVATTCPLVCPYNIFKIMQHEICGKFCLWDMLHRVKLVEIYWTWRREKILQGCDVCVQQNILWLLCRCDKSLRHEPS